MRGRRVKSFILDIFVSIYARGLRNCHKPVESWMSILLGGSFYLESVEALD